MIVFDDVTKIYGESGRGVKNLSFAISDGEIVFLTGATGSGKSTILNLLLAKIPPDDGAVFVGGKSLGEIKKKEIPAYRRGIGCVFQDFRLINDKTAGENVAVVFRIAGESKYEDKISAALEAVGISERASAFPQELSGGEQQRVAIARAIAGNPALILADEPTGNLDQKTGAEIMEILRKLNMEGKTVIVATHDMSLIGEHDRVLRLDAGYAQEG